MFLEMKQENLKKQVKRGGNMPPFKPTEQQRKDVSDLTAFGKSMEEIRPLIINKRTNKPVSQHTFRKAFKQEMLVGKTRADWEVAKTLKNMAVSGENTQATIWWTKARMGWSENMNHEINGNVQIELVADIAEKNDKKEVSGRQKVIEIAE